MEKLKGPFKEIIPIFQKYKKSIGLKYDNISDYNYLDKKLYDEKIITLDDSVKIFDVLVTNEVNEKRREKNYKCLLQLYDFMKILGYQNMYIEPLFFKNNSDFIAKVLTKREINYLFKKIDEECKTINENLYPIIFRLIYSCGLRISEVVNIKICDFSLENQAITIVKSKYNITRVLPLSSSMFNLLKTYLDSDKVKNNAYLFERNGKKISTYSLEKFMKNICTKYRIRVHDLRWTFAVHTLNNLFDENINSVEALYPLMIYMGHQSIESTEYYLQLTNEHYKEVVKKLDKKYPNIFPKVGDDNDDR